MLKHLKGLFTRLLSPLAGLLIRLGIGPDAVTIVGTLGVVASALWFFPRGELFWGSFACGVFALFDLLDGVLARRLKRGGRWGAYLDSTFDRVADGAVFAGLAWWFLTGGEASLIGGLALLCLVLGSLVSYAKARAEGVGCTANVGIAERADRLVAVLCAAGFTHLGLPMVVLTVTLALLAVASLVTVVQRMAAVYEQTRDDTT